MRRMTPATGCILVAALLAGCASPVASPPEPPPVKPVDFSALDTAVEAKITSGSLTLSTIRAVLVSVDGDTKLAHYRDQTKPTDAVHVWSVTKSVTSALIGLALEDKLIPGLDAPLSELIPRYQKQMSAAQRSTTLRQIMTMTAGFPSDQPEPVLHDVFNQRRDPVPTILAENGVQPPGQAFDYSSRSSHLVAVVLNEALRRADPSRPRSVLDYARTRLFGPLGIDTAAARHRQFLFDDISYDDSTAFDWGTDGAGVTSGYTALRLRPADMIKFGELYRNDGVWQGRQLLPRGWVEQTMMEGSLSAQYGLMWWIDLDRHGHRAWIARGWGGQLIAVMPDHRMTIAVASIPNNKENYYIDGDIPWTVIADTVLTAYD